jgi:tetratricopeptide (TPR) repeat protein
MSFLTACASAPVQTLLDDWPADLPDRVVLQQVPFVAQEAYQCGPATLAMAFGALGRNVSPQDLAPDVFLPGRQGSLQVEMLAAVRRHALLPYPLPKDLSSVLRELAAGYPVIVLQNLGLSVQPVWHYAVVIGYDRGQGKIFLHSGPTPELGLSLHTFDHTWARSGRWAVRVSEPAALPVTVDAETLVRALAALERSHPDAAQKGYQAALLRWPRQPHLLLGAGNTAFAQAQWPLARQHYQDLVRASPEMPDAWHNLALVEKNLGDLAAARAAIDRATQLGGVRLERYQALQRELGGPP